MLRAKGKVGGVPGTLPGLQGLATRFTDKRKGNDESVIFGQREWLETGKNMEPDSALVSSSDEGKSLAETTEFQGKWEWWARQGSNL